MDQIAVDNNIENKKELDSSKPKRINKYLKILIYFAIFLACFIPFFVYYCSYYYEVYAELPHLTWADMYKNLGGYWDGNLKFKDLLIPYGEHGMLGYYLLFLINLKYFNGTTFFDVTVNNIIILLIAIMFFACAYKTMKDKNIIYFVFFSLLFSFVFCQTSQLSSGAMETQVRITPLFFIPVTIYFSKILKSEKPLKWYDYLIYSLLSLICYNIFGTAYSLAIVPVYVAIFIVYCIRKKRINWISIVSVAVPILCAVLYLFEYNIIKLFTNGRQGYEGGLMQNIGYLLTHPWELVVASADYYGASIISYSNYSYQRLSNAPFYIFGSFGIVAILASLYVYFYKKMYEKTHVPLIFIGYSYFVFVLVYIGRGVGSPVWMRNEWYAVHAKYTWAALAWIIFSSLDYKQSLQKDKIENHSWKAILSSAIGLIASISMIFPIVVGETMSYKFQEETRDYISSYYHAKQGYFLIEYEEDMPVDEDGKTPLLLDLGMTMQMIKTVKEHHLSLWQEGYIKYGTNLDELTVTLGLYNEEPDGARFVAPTTLIPMNFGHGVDIEFYLPTSAAEDNSLSIYFDDVCLYHSDALTEGYNHLYISSSEVPDYKEGILRIKTKRDIASGGDQRSIGFLLLQLHTAQ